MAKEGLTKKRFEAYTSIIEKETNDYVTAVRRCSQRNEESSKGHGRGC
jgi:ureidoglycolate hydrolase